MKTDAIAGFAEFAAHAMTAGDFLRATLAKPTREAPDGLRAVYLRPVAIRGETLIAWTWRYTRRDEQKNLSAAESTAEIRRLAGSIFLHMDAEKKGSGASLRFNRRGEASLTFRRANTQPTEPDHQHDRRKVSLVDPHLPCWRALGLTSAHGQILPSGQDKWRQIVKFTEVIDSLLRRQPLPAGAKIADMGSGKGYLTFALHALLSARGLTPHIVGIEQRPELVTLCESIARQCGCHGLTFKEGGIAGWQDGRLDLLMALHACDTATDDAIAAGIRAGASIMVLAPCCHRQVRRSMESADPALAPLLRHGIFMERQAEMVTDALRALLLERAGYRCQVFEFISPEHTAKNVMITAVRDNSGRRSPAETEAEIIALKHHFGLSHHALEDRLNAQTAAPIPATADDP